MDLGSRNHFVHELHLFMYGVVNAWCMFVGIIKGIARRSRPPFDIKDQFITLFVKLFPFVLGASRIFINRDYASNVMIDLLLGCAKGNFHTVFAIAHSRCFETNVSLDIW
uniref:Uncharacterized protein n=1 Tax=Wuchereria bancrofti TaxID=6293 RepID=A0A1I8EQF0_WUCBA